MLTREVEALRLEFETLRAEWVGEVDDGDSVKGRRLRPGCRLGKAEDVRKETSRTLEVDLGLEDELRRRAVTDRQRQGTNEEP
jgi:hypothetical protein